MYSYKKIPELKTELKSRGLSVSGIKRVLIERLEKDDEKKRIEAGDIKINLRSLMGGHHTIQVNESKTGYELKEIVATKFQTVPKKVVLSRQVYDGPILWDETLGDGSVWRQINDEKSITSQGIFNGSTLRLYVRLI